MKIQIELDDDILSTCIEYVDNFKIYNNIGHLNLVAVIGERLIGKLKREHPEIFKVQE